MRKASENEIGHVADLCRQLLLAIGEDPDRPGLADTPARWARWWFEFMDYEDENLDTTFESIVADQMVVVKGIRVWSLCEHHLLPFYCDVSIGYVAKESVLGLSKFARIAHHHAHKLQLQERLVHDIAGTVADLTKTKDVAVIAHGEHLCMTMRGIRSPATMISSAMHGAFRSNPALRAEFMSTVQ